MLIETANQAGGDSGTSYPPLTLKPVTMTAQEVAKYFGVSLSSVFKLTKQGKLKGSKFFGRYLYYRDHIEALLTREFDLPPMSYRRRR